MKTTTSSVFLAVCLIQTLCFSSTTLDTLNGGSFLSVERKTDVLISSNGVFSAGFFPVGDNAFSFAVWFTNSSPPTPAWMANRDLPVNGAGSKLSLFTHGDLVLTDPGGVQIWSSKTSSDATSVQLVLFNTGNLVLLTPGNINTSRTVLWQSFDSPTNTLLPDQPFTNATQLVSSRSLGNSSSGFYRLYFDDNNVMSLICTGPLISSVYWPLVWKGINIWDLGRTTYNNTRYAMFDRSGYFMSSDNYTFWPTDFGVGPQRRLTLDTDGNLRMYGLIQSTGQWHMSWQLLSAACRVHGICGENSLCGYDPVKGRKCSCLQGFKMKNASDWSYGCEPEWEIKCNQTEVGFVRLTHVDFYGYDVHYIPNITLTACRNECLQMCNCRAFMLLYDGNRGVFDCYHKFYLINGHHSLDFQGVVYYKLPKDKLSIASSENTIRVQSSLACSGVAEIKLERNYKKPQQSESWSILLWFATGFGVFEVICVFLVWWYLYRNNQEVDTTSQGYMLTAMGLKRFSYSEIKKVTNNFSEEVGRGASGIVYKGTLVDGRLAAIKRLNEAKQGEAEFLAEITSIGKLNHMNLIEMWGYCLEGKSRFLVYEFIENGSLAENLSSKKLKWDKRFEIAVGTARGLAYLHEECLEWILHCDIKPQNILLDSNYKPKVADFGLSKLLKRGGGHNFSRIRGTRGYMAPEWVYSLPITSKVDVYSYGIVVLEMVTGKSPTANQSPDHEVLSSGHGRLVTWVKEKMMNKAWVEDVLDPLLLDCEYDSSKMEVLIRVALQCLEENRDARPTMRQVVEMLLSNQTDEINKVASTEVLL